MADYHDELVRLLAQSGCQRLDHIANGIYKWYSDKTRLVFNVEPSYPSLRAANEVLQRAGIGPILKSTREKP
jgi:hypothetical protein